jgi:ribosome-binding protein aMBF1 (putative translation factor)
MGPEACRAARLLLGWSQDDLADAAALLPHTVKEFEAGRAKRKLRYVPQDVSQALQKAGIVLIGDNPNFFYKKPE